MALFTTAIAYTASNLGSMRTIFTSESESGVIRQNVKPGQLFEFKLDFRRMVKTEVFTLVAFFEDNVGTDMTLTHPDHLTPVGVASGSPLVAGSQTGSTIATDNWPTSTTGLLVPGDIVSFGSNGGKVYRVTNIVSSTSGGLATINITPPISVAISNNIAVNYTGVLFNVLQTNSQVRYTGNKDNSYKLSINVRESI